MIHYSSSHLLRPKSVFYEPDKNDNNMMDFTLVKSEFQSTNLNYTYPPRGCFILDVKLPHQRKHFPSDGSDKA